jgi:hypothetical protein
MKRVNMIQPRDLARLALVSCAVVVALVGGGCGRSGRPALPSDDAARAALEASLKAWREGGKPGTIAGIDPPVQVLDTPWSQGERLGAYEILGSETNGAEKRFNVRLSLTKPEKVEEVKYYVVGQGPVMVFRDQDYLRNINMEDGPKLNKSGRPSRGRK